MVQINSYYLLIINYSCNIAILIVKTFENLQKITITNVFQPLIKVISDC